MSPFKVHMRRAQSMSKSGRRDTVKVHTKTHTKESVSPLRTRQNNKIKVKKKIIITINKKNKEEEISEKKLSSVKQIKTKCN